MPQPQVHRHPDPSAGAPTDVELVCLFVGDHGGVVTVAKILDAGHSRWVIRKALEAGALTRVRRGWVALPGADRFLIAAANRGVVLTCITQAKRLGLWVLDGDEEPHHVGADPRSSRVTTAENPEASSEVRISSAVARAGTRSGARR